LSFYAGREPPDGIAIAKDISPDHGIDRWSSLQYQRVPLVKPVRVAELFEPQQELGMALEAQGQESIINEHAILLYWFHDGPCG
jgi:hypothetical protein